VTDADGNYVTNTTSENITDDSSNYTFTTNSTVEVEVSGDTIFILPDPDLI